MISKYRKQKTYFQVHVYAHEWVLHDIRSMNNDTGLEEILW